VVVGAGENAKHLIGRVMGTMAMRSMRSYEEQNITSPSRSIEVKRGA